MMTQANGKDRAVPGRARRQRQRLRRHRRRARLRQPGAGSAARLRAGRGGTAGGRAAPGAAGGRGPGRRGAPGGVTSRQGSRPGAGRLCRSGQGHGGTGGPAASRGRGPSPRRSGNRLPTPALPRHRRSANARVSMSGASPAGRGRRRPCGLRRVPAPCRPAGKGRVTHDLALPVLPSGFAGSRGPLPGCPARTRRPGPAAAAWRTSRAASSGPCGGLSAASGPRWRQGGPGSPAAGAGHRIRCRPAGVPRVTWPASLYGAPASSRSASGRR